MERYTGNETLWLLERKELNRHKGYFDLGGGKDLMKGRH